MNGSISSRMPAPEYFGIESVSITALKEMKRSPMHYKWRRANPIKTKPMSLGTAAHCATLEPERFLNEFAIWSHRSASGRMSPRNGRRWDEFKAESGAKTIITEDESIAAIEMAVAVRNDAVAKPYLENGDPEVVLQTPDGRKGRIDWMTIMGDEHVIVGLKTARNCLPMKFGNAAAALGYHLQWAWYMDLYYDITGINPTMVEIVVESYPPYATIVYRVPDDAIAQGRQDYMKLLEQLRECERKNYWPGPATEVVTLSLPTWAYDQPGDDLSDLDLEISDAATSTESD